MTSGNNEIEGLISLAGNAEIRNSNNRLRIDGGLALGGRDLTMRVNGGQVEVRSPITGTGGIIKSGDRIMYAMPNGNPVHTFSGAVLIQDGEYEIRNLSGLGTSGGGTTVQNGAALLLRVAGTINENNININGNGHGNNGAIRSLDHNIDLTGTVTFDGNSRIRVDQDTLTLSGNVNMNNRNLSITGNGNLNITGQVFSGGQIDKFDNGTTTLAHASNSISGPININAGTVRVNSLGALGGASAVDVSAAGTFDVNGGGDFSAAPITLKGGTLSATGGNHTVALSAPGGGTILNTTGGTTLTVASPISLGIAGGLNFDGAGNIMVSQGFGNGSAGVSTPNALAHFGYHTGPNGVLDLNANGGMMGGGNPVNGPTFHGLALLTNGPGNRGLDFNNDGDFTATGAIGQNDQYSNLWLGTFTAPQTGNYGFRNAGDDDRGGIWFDNNQNGIFESNGNLNSGQNDQLSWEDGGWKTVALTAGQEYLIGFTHAEGGGGSRADFRFRGPGVSGEPIVKPGAASQAGLWKGFEITPDNNVVKSGSGTTTFAGNNSYNGTTTIEEGMLVAAHNNALGTFDGTAATGTSIAAGGTLGVQGNITIGNEHLTMAGGGSTIRNLSGNNAILTLNTVVTGEGATNIIADAGTLSIGGSGSMDLGVSQLVVDGAGFTTISQEISAAPIGSSVTTFTPGIQETIWDAANTGLISTDNVRNNIEPIRTAAAGPLGANDAQGILTGHLHYNGDGNVSARAAELGAVGFNNGDFTMLWTTEFTPDEAGNWGFRNNKVDDRYSFWIDLNDDGTFQADERFYKRDNCCGGSGDKYISDASSGIDSLVAGENYLLGLVMNDTGGGGYFRDMEFKAPSGGWTNLDPSANGNMFGLTNTVSAPAIDHLVKNGPGGLRLDGLLHFNGGVDATGGTLIVNADNIAGGAAQGDWNIASGVTLGGHGSINADVNIAATPGIVSPGDQAFANIGTTWSGDPTYSAGTTLETVGTLTFAELNLGGILQLDVLADGADQIAGEIYLGPLSQLRLGLDGTSYDPSSAEFAAIDFEALGFEEDDLFELVTGDVDGMFGNMVDFEPFIDASGALMVDFIGGAGSPYSLQFSAAVVPEPGAILIWSMMGMGLCGYGYRRRRNRLAIQSK